MNLRLNRPSKVRFTLDKRPAFPLCVRLLYDDYVQIAFTNRHEIWNESALVQSQSYVYEWIF